MSGEVTGRARVQRRVTDEQAVPQHAVGQVDQRAEIGGGGDVAAGDTSFEQCPQGGAALRGEIGQDLGYVLVMDGGGQRVART